MRKKDEHIAFDDLWQAHSTAGPSAALRTHLERCAACRDLDAEAQALREDLIARDLVEPPAHLLDAVTAGFPRRPTRFERIRELVARPLQVPSFVALAPAGVRGGLAEPARLVFEAAGLDVDLELSEQRGRLSITGQIAGAGRQGLPVLAWAETAGGFRLEAPVSEHGLFVLEPLPRARLDVVLDQGEQRVRLKLPWPEPDPPA